MQHAPWRSALGAFLLLAWTSTVAAGPPELPAQVDIGRDDPMRHAVRFDNSGGGLFLSDDGGASYRLMCNEVIDEEVSRETAGIVVGPGGVLFTATFTELWRGEADGCSWRKVEELSDVWVSDLVHDPVDPQVLYAVTGSGGGTDNGIYRYDGESDTWAPMGAFEPVLIGRLRVVETDTGLRFYESYSREEDAGVVYVVRYSDDAGETWTEHVQSGMDGKLALEDVDPSNPDRILLSIVYRNDPVRDDFVIVNDMAGDAAGNETIARPATFGGAAFGEGDEVWVGDSAAPLSVLRDGELTTVGDDLRAMCVHYDVQTDTLHLCRLTDFGIVDRATGEYSIAVDLRAAEAWVSCDGIDVPARCESRLGLDGWCGPMHYPQAPICEAYGYPGDPGGGGGGGDVGGAGDGGMGGDDGGGCGCRIAPGTARGAGGHGWPGAPGLLCLGLLALRRRHRGRRA